MFEIVFVFCFLFFDRNEESWGCVILEMIMYEANKKKKIEIANSPFFLKAFHYSSNCSMHTSKRQLLEPILMSTRMDPLSLQFSVCRSTRKVKPL